MRERKFTIQLPDGPVNGLHLFNRFSMFIDGVYLHIDLFWAHLNSKGESRIQHVKSIALTVYTLKERQKGYEEYAARDNALLSSEQLDEVRIVGNDGSTSVPELFDIVEFCRMGVEGEIFLCQYPLRRVLDKVNMPSEDERTLVPSSVTLLRSDAKVHRAFIQTLLEKLNEK